MKLWIKLLYAIGLGLVILGSFMSSDIWFKFRWGNLLFVAPEPNYPVVAAGLCCMLGGFLLWAR